MLKGKNTIRTTFLISFTSIFIFVLLGLGVYFGYRQATKIVDNKSYQQCLDEQKVADATALSYVPRIQQVNLSDGKAVIKGVLNNQNVEKFDPSFWGDDRDNKCWNKDISLNKANGNFTITITPNYSDESCAVNQFYRGGINLTFKITPKNDSLVCAGASKNASTSPDIKKFCTLNEVGMITSFIDNKWCMDGWVDLGLGSAPIWDLSDTELQKIGLNKANICFHGQSPYRKGKCINKNSAINLKPL